MPSKSWKAGVELQRLNLDVEEALEMPFTYQATAEGIAFSVDAQVYTLID